MTSLLGGMRNLRAHCAARCRIVPVMFGRARSALNARLCGTWRTFRAANGGNTVVTFALAFIPLVGLTGAAIDYSRANAIKTAMQSAADTTALAVASAAASQTSTALQASA